MESINKYLNKFKQKNIVVLGDIMLDKYIFGKVERISPEAPVPVVEVERERYVPGGAANAASNVATLTGNAILFGIVGNDAAKDILLDAAKERGISTEGIIIDGKKPTIQKIRIIGQNQQLVRIDYENKEYIDISANNKWLSILKSFKHIDAILISDYAKGTITKHIMDEIKKYAKSSNIPMIVDPKPIHKSYYKDISLITPNKKEAEEMSNIQIVTKEDVEKAGKKIMEELNCNVLITLGEKGMSLFEKNKEPFHIPTVAQEVYDVSGAGDTVIATLSLAISSGADFKEAAILANHAAGIKVGKLGTAPVTLAELEKNISNL
jgi:D-glycero-beta-D-manno-heptose-7-phosphate kinase